MHWSYVFLALTRRYKQNMPHVNLTFTSPVPEIHSITICHSFSTWAQCPQIWPTALATVFVSIASLVTHKRHHCRLTQSFTFKSGTHLPINVLLLTCQNFVEIWQVCSSDGMCVCLSVCLFGTRYRSQFLTNHHHTWSTYEVLYKTEPYNLSRSTVK